MNRSGTEAELREEICEIGRRLYNRGLCSGIDGNISIRLDEGFLCSPTGMCKGFLNPDDLCIVDADGHLISGSRARTSEILLHLEIYRVRADVGAVIHSHPPCATAFAISDRELPTGILAEAEVLLGRVPKSKYAMPGTMEFAQTVTDLLDGTSAVLLANHGAVTFGRNLHEAWAISESLENYAKILLLAGPFKNTSLLGPSEQAQLAAFRVEYFGN